MQVPSQIFNCFHNREAQTRLYFDWVRFDAFRGNHIAGKSPLQVQEYVTLSIDRPQGGVEK